MPESAEPDIDALAAAIGLELDPVRRAAVVSAFADIAGEIAKLRSLDLTDVHPAVVFSPHSFLARIEASAMRERTNVGSPGCSSVNETRR